MKILVTGGAGFIGSHLVDRLIGNKHKVAVIDNLSTGKINNLNRKVTFYKADICDPEIKKIFEAEKPDIIFHLAAQISVRDSVKDPLFDAQINILGSLNVMENFIKTYGSDRLALASKKFIFISTGGVMYGDADIIPTPETYPAQPICPYGVCKLAVENYLNYYHKVFGLPYAALRLGNVYGPRQNADGEAGVVAIFCEKMVTKKGPVINGDGLQARDYVYCDDVVGAAIAAMNKGGSGIYNIGTAKETSVNVIFTILKDMIHSDCEEVHGPAKSGDHKRGCLDYSKAKCELEWEPKFKISDGLKKTAVWFKDGQPRKANQKLPRILRQTYAE